MKKFFGKKQVLLGTLAVALGVAVYLNYYFAKAPSVMPDNIDTQTQTNPSDDKNLGEALNVNGNAENKEEQSPEEYFAMARENREASRKEATQTIKDLLSDVKATDEQKSAVTAQVIALTKAIEQESKIESLVKAKGFTDCLAYIESDKCSIVVQSDDLTAQDAAKISQVVTSQADIPAQKINIVAVN